jgi:hypothetical protein
VSSRQRESEQQWKLPNAHLAIADREKIGRIETASGRSPSIGTVWIVDKGNDKP